MTASTIDPWDTPEAMSSDFSTSRIIFLDLDGVLVDILPTLLAYHGLRCPYDAKWRASGKPEDPKTEQKLRTKGFWEREPLTSQGFWSALPAYPWTPGILKAARAWGTVRILTNPGRDAFSPAAAAGKLQWCLKALGIPAKDVVLAARKELLAAPGRILLDDHPENIDRWKAAGGIGLLFPQPYNPNYRSCARDPLEWFQEKLAPLPMNNP